MLILVVDDNPVELEVARAELEDAGYEVATLSSPFGVSAFVMRQVPAAVVLDVHMPALSGDKITTFLKSKIPDDVPVILHSGRNPDELAQLTRTCGADAFVAKGTGSLTSTVRRFARR